jgi:hypothetical protein
MRAFRTTSLMTAASLLALAIATPAFWPRNSPPTNEPTALDAVVITAQKRAQDRVEVPIAVTAYSGKFLEKIGVQEFDQLSAFTPGFVVQNQSNNNSGFVMRGITSDSGSATDETRVSIYQDGVPISRSRGSYVELFDMERIEVAKGPQSTLFGRGALIGAVNLVQNKADPAKSDWALKVEAGDTGYAMGEAMTNLAFNNGSALRLAVRAKQRDGYVDDAAGGDAYGSVGTTAVRIAYHLEPTEKLKVDLIGNWQEDDTTGTAFKSRTFNPTNPVTGAVLGDPPQQFQRDAEPRRRLRGRGAAGPRSQCLWPDRPGRVPADRQPQPVVDHRHAGLPLDRGVRSGRFVAADHHLRRGRQGPSAEPGIPPELRQRRPLRRLRGRELFPRDRLVAHSGPVRRAPGAGAAGRQHAAGHQPSQPAAAGRADQPDLSGHHPAAGLRHPRLAGAGHRLEPEGGAPRGVRQLSPTTPPMTPMSTAR